MSVIAVGADNGNGNLEGVFNIAGLEEICISY